MADKNKNWFARHKVLTVILALIVLGVIGSAAGGGNKATNSTTSSSSSSNTAKSDNKPQMAKIGGAARDGKFEFVVSSVQCGVASVGDNPYLTKTAQGQFCLLNVTVKNIGNEKQS
ncbi:MAG: DUF4352 domain-containing protein, partial [Patescibacteria group bacterium]